MKGCFSRAEAECDISVSKLLGLENLVSIKVSKSVSKKFGTGKSIGIGFEKNWHRKNIGIGIWKKLASKKELVSVSEKIGMEKSIGCGIKKLVSEKSFGSVPFRFWVSSHTGQKRVKHCHKTFPGSAFFAADNGFCPCRQRESPVCALKTGNDHFVDIVKRDTVDTG